MGVYAAIQKAQEIFTEAEDRMLASTTAKDISFYAKQVAEARAILKELKAL